MSRISRAGLFVFLLMLLTSAAWSQPRISILPGDASLQQTLDVIQQLQTEMPALQASDIRVYSSTRARQQDMEHLARSDLIIIQMVGRAQISRVRAEITQAIDRGGRVYAYGSSINGEDEEAGILQDPALQAYFNQGGAENIRNGLLYALGLVEPELVMDVTPAQPVTIPDVGIYNARSGAWHTDYASFLGAYDNHQPGRPWVGFVVYQSDIVAGNTAHIDAVIHELETRDLNVLTVFGYPSERPIEQYLFDEKGKSRVEVVIAASIKIGVQPEVMTPLLQRLDVPVINAISLFSLSRAEWEASPVGMDINERAWQLAMPEMAGLIQPTVFAAKEVITDPETGTSYVAEIAIPERVAMLANRVERWIVLRQRPNAEKRVFLQYFNFPPGRESVGASYLNVLPESLWQVMQRLEQEGYDLGARPENSAALREDILQYGVNLPGWTQQEVDALAQSGEAVLLPVATYKQWFAELPLIAQAQISASWGEPEDNAIMSYVDAAGLPYFVLPVRRYGNVLVGPQPSRGKTEEPEKLHHDMMFPPSHQYIAFYFWLHKEFGADAMFQFGSHGTHEWLPGKEAGMNIDDAPEYLIQDLPNLYAFIMDNAGEGTIAMRRSMAVMITHLTPPFDRLGLNPELRELEERINDYNRAVQQSPLLADGHLRSIHDLAENMGILVDLDLAEAHDHTHHAHEQAGDAEAAALVDTLYHYLQEIGGRITPFGMHTFGVAPDDAEIQATVDAILSVDSTLDEQQRHVRAEELTGLIGGSAQRELDAMVAGLAGRYIAAGPGADPLRNSAALPTGRNFYSFDPRRLPSASTFDLGQRLADELVEDFRSRHGDYPEKLTFTLWGVETMRTEGVQESQIMHLMGVRPVYDAQGVVRGVEAISREQLGRPRIDVTVIPSGLHRDLFSNVVSLLDQAASVAQDQDEPDNHVRNNTLGTTAQLVEQGVDAELAARMAAVRLFSVPPGAYGTNLEAAIDRSDTWESEQTLADMYFMRMSHLYGQGFWGDSGAAGGVEGLGIELLKNALSGTRMTVHARSSNVFQVLDGDDPFASFGGVSMAVRAVDGVTPEVMISNLSDPAQARQESIERFMGREMRSRYLNPEWITAMQAEGYAGAKFINDVVQNMWGWQVTVPEAVDAAKWNEMYETYVQDRYDLDMEQFFRDADNIGAYQAMMARMLEAVRKDYWTPDATIIQDLGERVSELASELLMVCDDAGCEDPLLDQLVQANLVRVPSALPSQSSAAGQNAAQAPGQAASVQGYVMEEVVRSTQSQAAPPVSWAQPLIMLLLTIALLFGFANPYRGQGLRQDHLRQDHLH